MQELVCAFCVGADDHVFFDEMNDDAAFVKRRPVFDVPIESVGFFDEDDRACVPFEVCEHLRETFSTGSSRGFHIDKFRYDTDVVGVGVLAQ